MASAPARHDYHLVEPSPWPFIGALGLFILLVGAVMWMNGRVGFADMPPFAAPFVFAGGVLLMAATLAGWWYDIVTESVAFGEHKPVVMLAFRFAGVLFILAEAIFFAVLLLSYYDMALFRSAGIGWPPPGVPAADPWRLPLFATAILLLSGTTVRWAHRSVLTGDRKTALKALAVTVFLGAAFTLVLACDLSREPFTLAAAGGVPAKGALYGSVFFLVAGAFFLHIAAGTVFLAVCMLRASLGHFTPERHFGFEIAAWYWHFGVAVWLVLYAGVYVMGYAFAAPAPLR
jgi:cytochrome c oxidase subunit 3